MEITKEWRYAHPHYTAIVPGMPGFVPYTSKAPTPGFRPNFRGFAGNRGSPQTSTPNPLSGYTPGEDDIMISGIWCHGSRLLPSPLACNHRATFPCFHARTSASRFCFGVLHHLFGSLPYRSVTGSVISPLLQSARVSASHNEPCLLLVFLVYAMESRRQDLCINTGPCLLN